MEPPEKSDIHHSISPTIGLIVIEPVSNKAQIAIEILHQSSTVLDPTAIVAVDNAIDIQNRWEMQVTANNTVIALPASQVRTCLFIKCLV
ncbi:MAG TPA: hypothetical protein DEO43_08320 [Halieaceae bacterium]|nr:hypothetical protein [Halieaceae bacterium]